MKIHPRKRFAQHWLRSEETLSQIVQAAELQSGDRLLEIGPGTGILTRRLLSVVSALVAVEIDRDLCQNLVRSLGKSENFLLLQGDILSLDLEQNLGNFPAFQLPNKVVANIPYNITSPILEYLLGTIAQPAVRQYELIVLLIQKEVAERLVAQPKTKARGALTVGIEYLAVCEWISDVPAQAFYPAPKVDSAVVRIRPHKILPPVNSRQKLSQLIRLGFSERRKMLRNNLKSIIESDRLLELLAQLNINPQARAEELSLSDWITLANALHT